MADILSEFGTRGGTALLGLLVGSLVTWLITRWKRHLQRRSVLRGDARDTVVLQQHVIQKEKNEGQGERTVLRIRSLGQGILNHVIPNGHLASVLLHRAWAVTPRNTLISMEGAEGSYLLETLTNFVCDRAANAPFAHDLYVMAPCCEPSELSQHQPITILLISMADLVLFESWVTCRDLFVEHGSDGARILTLIELAHRFKEEQATLDRLRREGKRTTFVETIYILDLALDRQTAAVPIKKVPWGRFESVLKQLNLE